MQYDWSWWVQAELPLDLPLATTHPPVVKRQSNAQSAPISEGALAIQLDLLGAGDD